MPFGISSELKLTAHYKTYGHSAVKLKNNENSIMNGLNQKQPNKILHSVM